MSHLLHCPGEGSIAFATLASPTKYAWRGVNGSPFAMSTLTVRRTKGIMEPATKHTSSPTAHVCGPIPSSTADGQ